MEIDFWKRLVEINGEACVEAEVPMRKHTTFRIGGNARYFVRAVGPTQLWETMEACKTAGMPYYILGNGSNVLISDKGYPGVIIRLDMQQIVEEDGEDLKSGRLRVQAGALLVRVAHQAARLHLSGLEFASGIPGSVGGALVMNAGAYGGEMKGVVEKALVLTQEGRPIWLSQEELELGYRTSVIGRKSYVVLEAVFLLEKRENSQPIWDKMEELKKARVEKQPLEYASAGSTFKRPIGYFAGKLIMDAGLRGYQIGGAQVSEKHCGFIINRGDATAQDVLDLVEHVKTQVKHQFGVDLEMEIKLLGF
ncbi:MAG: UDP-N-acetylmuramate dehydrogenase [Lachnospiraceae bacterium]|nr:UDP-N-acetylmuramate dehydrogenase [Lachnospiraceae bacterium]